MTEKKTRSSLGSVKPAGAGMWRVRVSKGCDPVTGKRVYAERRVRGSRREAEATLARMLVENGEAGAASSMTLADYMHDLYMPWCESRLRPDTCAHYRHDIDGHIVPGIGGVRLSDLDGLTVERWLAGIEKPGARKSAYKTLRQGLRQARLWKIVRDVATDAVPEPKVPHYEPRVLTAEEATAVLDAFAGSEIEVAVLLALGCGLRRSEICGLDWEDVDLESGTVDVRRSYVVTDGVGVEGEPKTFNSRRTVSLPEGFRARLAEIAPPEAHGPVMLATEGGRMHPDVLTNKFERHARREGVYFTPLRNLRHSHATIMLSAGVDVVTVSRRLGHSSVSITDKYYLRPLRAADERAADAFDSLGMLPTISHN